MLPLISVIVPTVDGREDHLERCVRTYTELAAGNYELQLIIERNHPTCGLGWQAGSEKAEGGGEKDGRGWAVGCTLAPARDSETSTVISLRIR